MRDGELVDSMEHGSGIEAADGPVMDVQTGPGVAADAVAYTADRLRGLERFAPRPITAIHAWVTKPRDTVTPGNVVVRVSLSVGNHVLRARGDTSNLRSSLDVACDRLRRRLTDLPHGQRGDFTQQRQHHGG